MKVKQAEKGAKESERALDCVIRTVITGRDASPYFLGFRCMAVVWWLGGCSGGEGCKSTANMWYLFCVNCVWQAVAEVVVVVEEVLAAPVVFLGTLNNLSAKEFFAFDASSHWNKIWFFQCPCYWITDYGCQEGYNKTKEIHKKPCKDLNGTTYCIEKTEWRSFIARGKILSNRLEISRCAWCAWCALSEAIVGHLSINHVTWSIKVCNFNLNPNLHHSMPRNRVSFPNTQLLPHFILFVREGKLLNPPGYPAPCAGKRKRVSPSSENKEQMNIPFQKSQKFLAHPETSYSKVSATALFLVFLIHVNDCSHALRMYHLQYGRSYQTVSTSQMAGDICGKEGGCDTIRPGLQPMSHEKKSRGSGGRTTGGKTIDRSTFYWHHSPFSRVTARSTLKCLFMCFFFLL